MPPHAPSKISSLQRRAKWGVIALTTTKITRQHDIVSFSQGTACKQIFWSNGPWTGGEIEPTWENYSESQGYKPTAICKKCGFKELCILTLFTPTEVPPSFPSPPPSWCCFRCSSPEGCVGAQVRWPEPTMTKWGNASKTCTSIPQNTATRASFLLPRVLALHSFLAQQRNNSSTGADDQAQNRRI